MCPACLTAAALLAAKVTAAGGLTALGGELVFSPRELFLLGEQLPARGGPLLSGYDVLSVHKSPEFGG